MSTIRNAVLMFTALLIAPAPLALAQGTYTQIDVPGSISTFVYGIDTAGDVIGEYVGNGPSYHGFLLSGGVYTTIDYPGASATGLHGMNDNGQFVGYTGVPVVGFVYSSQTQTFATIAYPGAISTFPTAINNIGAVAGYYEDSTGEFGFALMGSTYRRIVPGNASNSVATGLTASGQSAGYLFLRNNGYANFLLTQGHYQQLTIPKAPSAVVAGISPKGTAFVGGYLPSSGVNAGFVYQRNVLISLQFPGSTSTAAYGVNDGGEVVGTFYDASGTPHGFTWQP